MSKRVPEFERFVRLAHARRVLWLLVESVGLCAAVGSVAGILLGSLLLTRGESAMPIVAALLGLSIPAGLLLGWTRRPTLISTAVEVDRQLRLDDLLSSAMAARNPSDAWADSLRTIADATIRGRSTNVLILRRLGVRAWGGIGLATAMVIAIGLLGSDPVRSTASDRGTPAPSASAGTVRRLDSATDLSAQAAAKARQDVSRKESEPGSENAGDQTAHAETTSSPARTSDNKPSVGSASAGAGSSQTRQHAMNRLPQTDHATATSAVSSDAGRATDGARTSADRVESANDRDGSLVLAGDRSTAPTTAPWQTREWARDADAALQKVGDGSVPSRYGDLVRGYFARD